jgi:hypothetical protein
MKAKTKEKKIARLQRQYFAHEGNSKKQEKYLSKYQSLKQSR